MRGSTTPGKGTADLNVNGSYTLGPVTESNRKAGFAPSFKSNTPGNLSSFGSFDLSLNINGGFPQAATTDTSALWSTAAGVLIPNNDGFVAGVHALACNEPGCGATDLSSSVGICSEW